jgi:hypothetical protein
MEQLSLSLLATTSQENCNKKSIGLYSCKSVVRFCRRRTNSVQQSLSWEATSHSASQEVSHLYEARMFITVFKRTCHWSLY